MRVFIAVLVLIFSFQSLTKADDISEITIEGMSIGESALKYFSEDEIKKNTVDYFKIKTYVPAEMGNYSFYQTYDAVDFTYKNGDKEYKISSLNGVLFIEDIEACEKQLDQIVKDISSVLISAFEIEKSKIIHGFDPSGKSYIIEKQWVLDDGNRVLVQCYNYNKSTGSQNHLAVSIRTKEYHNFLRKIAYNEEA